MNSFVITGATIVTPHEVIENGFLYVKKGIIESIEVMSGQKLHRSCNRIDGRGRWLFPGIIDVKSNSLKKELTGGRNGGTPVDMAFFSVENRLSSCGVTTVCHNLPVDPEADKSFSSDMNRLKKLGVIRHDFQCISGAGRKDTSPFKLIPALDIVQTCMHEGSPAPTGIMEGKLQRVLYSDETPASILYAIFMLNGNFGVSMPEAVKMATFHPSQVLGLDRKLGSLENGKIADLVLVRKDMDAVIVEKVFVDGYKIYEKYSFPHGNSRINKMRFIKINPAI